MKLICAYVLAYAKNRFSHAAQLSINLLTNLLQCGRRINEKMSEKTFRQNDIFTILQNRAIIYTDNV